LSLFNPNAMETIVYCLYLTLPYQIENTPLLSAHLWSVLRNRQYEELYCHNLGLICRCTGLIYQNTGLFCWNCRALLSILKDCITTQFFFPGTLVSLGQINSEYAIRRTLLSKCRAHLSLYRAHLSNYRTLLSEFHTCSLRANA